MTRQRLGSGLIGSGFVTRFHIRSLVGVRDADVRGCWSPDAAHAESAAARALDVGEARAFPSIEAMVSDPAVDAVWLCGPNHARLANLEAICAAVRSGATLRGVACEKPLARTVAEAKRMLALAEEAGLGSGYPENQVFAPPVTRGRELIWRRGAALTGRPTWRAPPRSTAAPTVRGSGAATYRGGGVLNDMACHSVEVVRHLLTPPGAPATPSARRVTGRIASLEWSRPEYSERLRRTMGEAVDYARRPAEENRRRDHRVRGRRRHGAHPRGHHVVELRRPRPAAEH